MISLMNTKIPNQPKEEYYGNREYKLLLNSNRYTRSKNQNQNQKREKPYKNDIDHSDLNIYIATKSDLKKLQKRATQMLFRINEGKGKAIYIIGIDDDGKNTGIPIKDIHESITYLDLLSKQINATINNYRIYLGENGYILTARVVIEPYQEIEFF
jgi:GTPase